MSATSKKKRRVVREAMRRIDSEMTHRVAYYGRMGGLEAVNNLIVPNPKHVADHYLAKGRWRI